MEQLEPRGAQGSQRLVVGGINAIPFFPFEKTRTGDRNIYPTTSLCDPL